MSTFSDYLEEKLLEHTFCNTAYTTPGTTLYLALYTTAPTDSTSGTEVSNGNGYSRQQIAFNAYSAGKITNNGAETFTASGGNWGTVVAVAVTDNATHGSGNILAYTTITPSVTVNDGESFTLDDQKLEISLD